jgi:hypothetical protein
MASTKVRFNGVDVSTGGWLTKETTVEALVEAVKAAPPPQAKPKTAKAAAAPGMHAFLPFGVQPGKLDQAGWGIVFPAGTTDEVKAALAPLIAHRKAQTGAALCYVLDYKANESASAWLTRHGASVDVDPSKVPLFLLLIGGPEQIPFETQYLLDFAYAVGRLSFETATEYAAYAASVIAYETATTMPTTKDVCYWATDHNLGDATALSAGHLVQPLCEGKNADGDVAAKPIAPILGFGTAEHLGAAAKKQALVDVLAGKTRPSLLFTASHGAAVPCDAPNQKLEQGALMTQEWPGPGAPDATDPRYRLRASDVDDTAVLSGLFVFMFACFSAGTPAREDFVLEPGQPRKPLATTPFVSALARRLLGHPKGTALAVIGHVERAWSYSIQPDGVGDQLMPFRNMIGQILSGDRVGTTTQGFTDRSASLGNALLAALTPGNPPVDDRRLVLQWLEHNDAQNYVVLGDPAVRLRTELFP